MIELESTAAFIAGFEGFVDHVKTLAAVTGFQQREGLGTDGMVGPSTWSAMWRPRPG